MSAERSAPFVRRRNKPSHTQIEIIRRFCRKLSDISLQFEIFRRLNALCTALCVQNLVDACPPTSKQAQIHANCNNLSILSKIKSYFSRVSDISTFKRSFHCIMLAQRSAPFVRRRNKPSHTQIAINRRFCTKLSDNFSPIRDISTFKRTLHWVMLSEPGAGVFRRRKKLRHTQTAIIRWFCRKLCDISLPFEIFLRLNALCTALWVPNVVHAFSVVETSPDTRKLQ